MSDEALVVLVAGLVATACGLLGPFLLLRRMALLSDAVSHAVLPGIVAVWLVAQTRAPLPVILGAAVFAVLCVLLIDGLRATGLVASDAAIALAFPAMFSLGVLGITRFASGIHLDLDATIYGELALVPFTTVQIGDAQVVRAALVLGAVAAADLLLLVLLWKEYAVTTFDPEFAASVALRPRLLTRLLVIAVAVTAVSAFEAVGAILVVTMLVVPAATAYVLTQRLTTMVAVSVGVGWIGALGGQRLAFATDSSIAGAMGLVCAGCFVAALAYRHLPELRRRALRAP